MIIYFGAAGLAVQSDNRNKIFKHFKIDMTIYIYNLEQNTSILLIIVYFS